MSFYDFMESLGRKGVVRKVGTDSELPERCEWCGHKFIYDIKPPRPPAVSTSCKCGQWIITVPE